MKYIFIMDYFIHNTACLMLTAAFVLFNNFLSILLDIYSLFSKQIFFLVSVTTGAL